MNFLHRLIRTLILPNNAGPNDPAIIIGPDLPPCMQSRYSSAIFFRPPDTASNPLNRPIKFIGQVINPISGQVDEGWALYDQKSPPVVCGFYVYKTTITTLAPSGSGNSLPQEFYNDIIESGSATMNQGGVTNFGSTAFGAATRGWTVNIGDGTALPSKAEFTIDGVSAPRGPRMAVSGSVGVSSGNGLTTPAVESSLFSAFTNGTNSMVWYNGRTYCVGCTVSMFNNLAGAGTVYAWSHYQVNIRSIHSGAILGATQDASIQSGHLDDDKYFQFYIKNDTGADITSGLEISVIKGASSIGATMTIDSATITVHDVGSSSGRLSLIAGVMS